MLRRTLILLRFVGRETRGIGMHKRKGHIWEETSQRDSSASSQLELLS